MLMQQLEKKNLGKVYLCAFLTTMWQYWVMLPWKKWNEQKFKLYSQNNMV